MKTDMSRGPLAEDEHSRKGNAGGRPAFGRPPPHFLFCRGHPLPFPLHFCLHFIRRSMGNLYYFLMLMLMKMLMLMLYVLIAGSFVVFFMLGKCWRIFVMFLCVLCIVVFFFQFWWCLVGLVNVVSFLIIFGQPTKVSLHLFRQP